MTLQMQCNTTDVISDINIRLVRYVNVYYHYQLNVNVVDTYFVGPFNTQPLGKVYLFDITFAMKIRTADRCNKKSSSFTNTRILCTKDKYNTTTSRDKKTAFH